MDIKLQKAPRQMNVELLRVVCMMMVLALHANFYPFGMPDKQECLHAALPSFTRCWIETMTIVAVDVFVMISGWFGLNARRRSYTSFIFTALFFSIGSAAFFAATGYVTFDKDLVLDALQLSKCLWFVKAYLMLLILSPILNAFVAHTDRRTFAATLIGFFIFQTVFNFFGDGGQQFFSDGYSPLSFIGLYLLARYMRLYRPRWTQLRARTDLRIYLACGTLMGTLLFLCNGWHFLPFLRKIALHYTNPLTIAGATFLLLAFTKLRINRGNRLIGILATASFAVYVLHCTAPFTETVYHPIVKDIYKNYSGIACPLLIFSTMCCVYLLCTLLDQARQWCWKQLTRTVPWLAGAKAE